MKRKVGGRWGKEGDQITENRDSEPGVYTQIAGPHPHFLTPQVWGGAREFAFLTSSQGIRTLRDLGRGTASLL